MYWFVSNVPVQSISLFESFKQRNTFYFVVELYRFSFYFCIKWIPSWLCEREDNFLSFKLCLRHGIGWDFVDSVLCWTMCRFMASTGGREERYICRRNACVFILKLWWRHLSFADTFSRFQLLEIALLKRASTPRMASMPVNSWGTHTVCLFKMLHFLRNLI